MNINFKNYPKTYENVFSEDVPNSKSRLQVNNISALGMELNEYRSLAHNFITEMYSDIFLQCVKLSWLRRKFVFYGSKTIVPMQKNSRVLANAFTKFLRRNIGNDIQLITKGKYFNRLDVYYFDQLFPGFEDENPFENPDFYKFPYKNISMEFLLVVFQLEDRFELLEEADKREMSYAVFLDYILNHTLTENELLGYNRYELTQNSDRKSPYYIKDNYKLLKGKKKKYE